MKKCFVFCVLFFVFGCETNDSVPPPTLETCVEDITDLPSSEIYDYIYKNEMPVIVEAYTSWCGECAQYISVFQEVCVDYCEEIKFFKIDVDAVFFERGEWLDFFIGVVPSTYFFNNGEEIFYITGLMSEDELKKEVEEFLYLINN